MYPKAEILRRTRKEASPNGPVRQRAALEDAEKPGTQFCKPPTTTLHAWDAHITPSGSRSHAVITRPHP